MILSFISVPYFLYDGKGKKKTVAFLYLTVNFRFESHSKFVLGMDCTYKDETYEEGVGIYDTDIACRMFVCEYGVMKPFFTSKF